jgi:hypothetical protein
MDRILNSHPALLKNTSISRTVIHNFPNFAIIPAELQSEKFGKESRQARLEKMVMAVRLKRCVTCSAFLHPKISAKNWNDYANTCSK